MESLPDPPLRNINDNNDDDFDGGITADEKCALLQRNDPELNRIRFGTDPGDILPHGDDWGKFGDCIKRNTHLKSVEWGYFGCEPTDLPMPTFYQIKQLFTKMRRNKSIETLAISSFQLDGDEVPAMVPLTKGNNLISLELGAGGGEVHLGGSIGDKLAKMLASFSSLRFFECSSDDSISSDASLELITALSRHRCLEDLSLSYVLRGWTESYQALAEILLTCTKLNTLEIRDDNVADTCAAILAIALASTKSLKELVLNMEMGEMGWMAISNLLVSKSTNIASVKLFGGWANNAISSNVLSSMASNIAHSKKLKQLDLYGNMDISWGGWESLFDYIADSKCSLENLNISHTGMSNDSIDMFTAALAKNSSLTSIDISRNRHVTVNGLRGFGKVFQSSHSVLESISINPLDDKAALLLSSFLSGSCKIKSISSPYSGEEEGLMAHEGAKAFEDVVCNKKDIMATYNSNHTFHNISLWGLGDGEDVPDLKYALALNEKWVPWYCARLKILKYHFSGAGVNLKPFFGMSLELLHHAMAWIGSARDSDMMESTNVMYQLMKSIPSLLDLDGKRKRKRTKRTKISDYFMPASK